MTTGEQPERHPDDLDADLGPSDMADAAAGAPGIDRDIDRGHDLGVDRGLDVGTHPDGDPVRARAKRLAVCGAVTLWIVSPLLIGGFITAAVHVADHGGAHGLAMAGFVVWAVVCFVVMSLGFLMLMGGVYLWWRSRNPLRPLAARPSDERREAVLRELREELRTQDARPEGDDSARP